LGALVLGLKALHFLAAAHTSLAYVVDDTLVSVITSDVVLAVPGHAASHACKQNKLVTLELVGRKQAIVSGTVWSVAAWWVVLPQHRWADHGFAVQFWAPGRQRIYCSQGGWNLTQLPGSSSLSRRLTD
jgi:hypothetical protein